MKWLWLHILAFVAFVSAAQNFPIGSRTITFNDPTRSGGFGSGGGPGRQIQTEIYYPAVNAGTNTAVASGRFPVVVFGHGFLMTWDAYKPVYDSLVRIGYVVALPRTEGNISPSHLDFGKDLALVLNSMLALDTVPSSPFFNRLNGKGAIGGHSMGGGATFLSDAFTTRATCYFTFAAAETNPKASTAAKSMTKPHLLLAGTFDCVTPIATNQQIMYDSLASSCKSLVSIIRGYHCHFNANNTNCAFGEGTCFTPGGMTRDSQLLMVRFYLHPYLNYYLKGDCSEGQKFKDRLTNPHKATVQQNCILNIPLPAAVVGDSQFCSGESAVVEALPAGFIYRWNDGVITRLRQVSAAGNYSVKISNGDCETETSPFAVAERFPPSKPTINPLTGLVCSNVDSVVLTSNVVPNANGYVWQYPSSWLAVRDDSSHSVALQVNSTGNVYLKAYNDCGFSSEDSIEVSVKPLPTFSGTLNGPAVVCANYPIALFSLSGSFIHADTIIWSSQSWSIISGQGNLSASFQANSAVDTITVSSVNSCQQSYTLTYSSQLADTTPVTISNNSGLLVATGGGVFYQWYKNDTAISGATGATYQPTESGWYYVVLTNAHQCSSISNAIYYSPTPSVTEDDWFTNSEPIVFPNPANDYFIIKSPLSGRLYIWDVYGRLVDHLSVERNVSIRMDNIPHGIYFVALSGEGKSFKKIKLLVRQYN
jgi:pimeloyl-ACP methyl ester carboxylesterase